MPTNNRLITNTERVPTKEKERFSTSTQNQPITELHFDYIDVHLLAYMVIFGSVVMLFVLALLLLPIGAPIYA